MADLPTSPSLLLEADPLSFSELTNRDPESYTRQDRDHIIAELRAARLRFEAAEAAGRRVPRLKKDTLPSLPDDGLPIDPNAPDLGF